MSGITVRSVAFKTELADKWLLRVTCATVRFSIAPREIRYTARTHGKHRREEIDDLEL